MTNKEAQEIYDQTGNLKDFLINNIDAYKQELATNKKISQTKFHHMNTSIEGCKLLVKYCFEKDAQKSNS
jgi:hypothetical protein